MFPEYHDEWLNRIRESMLYGIIATSRSLCFRRVVTRAQASTHKHTHIHSCRSLCAVADAAPFRVTPIDSHAACTSNGTCTRSETCRPNNIDGLRSVPDWRTNDTNVRRKHVRYYRILYTNMRFAYYYRSAYYTHYVRICVAISFSPNNDDSMWTNTANHCSNNCPLEAKCDWWSTMDPF